MYFENPRKGDQVEVAPEMRQRLGKIRHPPLCKAAGNSSLLILESSFTDFNCEFLAHYPSRDS